MTDISREARLSAAFVKIASTLVADFDVVELLQTLADECSEILDTQAGGIMLLDGSGHLQLIVSTSEESEVVEVMTLNAGEGPCMQSVETGLPVTVGDIAASGGEWPVFQAEALRNGFRSVHVTPLRLRGRVLGALNLFSIHEGELREADIDVAQALADVAAIALVQGHKSEDEAVVTRQLQQALNARVLIEQAKGVIAESEGVSIGEAFLLLRDRARDHSLTLTEAAVLMVSSGRPAGLPREHDA